MNQIASGGDDPTPPEGGTTRVPQTSQSQGPAPSLPPSRRTSKEIRTADTATMCQTRSAFGRNQTRTINHLSINECDANGSQGFREGLEFLLRLDRALTV
jgi:hypothetical protein